MPYDDSQARDKDGKWTSGGSSGGGLPPSAYAAGMAKAPRVFTKRVKPNTIEDVNIDDRATIRTDDGYDVNIIVDRPTRLHDQDAIWYREQGADPSSETNVKRAYFTQIKYLWR